MTGGVDGRPLSPDGRPLVPDGRPVLPAVAVALLVLASGAALAATPSPAAVPDGAAAAVQPAPAVQSASAVSADHQPAPLPPGVNESGVEDPVRLVDAHTTILGNASYTVTSSRVERFRNGTHRSRVDAFGHRGVGGEFRYVTAVEETADRDDAGPAGTSEVWSNGSLTAAAFTNATGTDYQLRGRTDPSLDHQEELLVLFGALETTVTNRSASNGTAVYRVEATDVRHPADLARAYDVDAVSNVTFSAAVTSEGLVREYRLAFDAERGEATTRIVETVRFSAVGSTTVARPGWVPEALTQVNATSE